MIDSRVFISQKLECKRCIPLLDMGNDFDLANAARITDKDVGEVMVAAKDIK